MKKILTVVMFCIMSIANMFAMEPKNEIPSLFGVYPEDNVNEAVKKLENQGFEVIGNDGENIMLISPLSTLKFGEQIVGAFAITYKNGRCKRIGIMFRNEYFYPTKYRKALQDYLKHYSDVETGEIDKPNASGDGGIYSYWIINNKYIVYSEETSEDGRPGLTILDRDSL